jgi:hypothetical protein
MSFERKQQQHLTGWGVRHQTVSISKVHVIVMHFSFQVEYELEGSCFDDYLPPQVKVRSCAKRIVAVLSISQLHM